MSGFIHNFRHRKQEMNFYKHGLEIHNKRIFAIVNKILGFAIEGQDIFKYGINFMQCVYLFFHFFMCPFTLCEAA
jgi:hypothetical protein